MLTSNISNPAFLVVPPLPAAVSQGSVPTCRRRRRNLLTPSSCASVSNPGVAHTAEPLQSVQLRPPPTRVTAPALPEHLFVRQAENSELYVVAEVRCEAFYDNPMDTRYYPVRRREIYQAMKARIASGTRCIVTLDTDPPSHWRPFSVSNGSLVVGSLDISLHRLDNGKRHRFEAPVDEDTQSLAYISSMAVRPSWKRRGLARSMLLHTDGVLRAMGLNEVYLHVDEENEAAVKLYECCGFKVVDKPMPSWVHELAKEEHTLMVKRYGSHT